MVYWMAIVSAAIVACGNTGGTNLGSANLGSAKATAEPPVAIRVVYGDCANKQVAFVSGPKPRPFDPETVIPQDPQAAVGVGFLDGRVGTYDGAHPRDESLIVGQPTVGSGFDPAIVKRYVRRWTQALTFCYDQGAEVTPGLAGTITAEFTIDADGRAKAVTASGVDDNVATCIAGVIENIEFPAPKPGPSAVVRVPLTFHATQPAKPRPATPPAPSVADYRPGTANPLRAQDPAIVECLRAQPARHGAMVVELGFDPTGAVSHATAFGGTAKVRACVADAAKKLEQVGGPGLERCGFAFGRRSLSGLAAVDITAAGIAWNGAAVASLDDIVVSPSAAPIAPLSAAVTAYEQASTDASEVLVIHEPGLIRPIGDTPMKVVTRVIATMDAARDSFVLAAKDGADWRPLRDLELPAAPVPLGTGGSWNPPEPRSRAPAGHARIVVHVSPSDLRLGIDHPFLVFHGTGEWNRFEAKLRELKALPSFVDRTDITIVTDDDVPYARAVHVIDAANAAGFTAWRVGLYAIGGR